nr:helicase HerA-like domain-containing protein [Paratractidigestivibacter sp.]
MLSDLFGKLPEVGDIDKPKFVFFNERGWSSTTCPPS